jgi:hypothetical protein
MRKKGLLEYPKRNNFLFYLFFVRDADSSPIMHRKGGSKGWIFEGVYHIGKAIVSLGLSF